jgi:hypothetical protein
VYNVLGVKCEWNALCRLVNIEPRNDMDNIDEYFRTLEYLRENYFNEEKPLHEEYKIYAYELPEHIYSDDDTHVLIGICLLKTVLFKNNRKEITDVTIQDIEVAKDNLVKWLKENNIDESDMKIWTVTDDCGCCS